MTNESAKEEAVENNNDKKHIALSPLADPVVSAIFESVEVAGDAANSIICAVLGDNGEAANFGKIISVTPQRVHSEPGVRGVRVDVEVVTDANQKAIIEVQLFKDSSMLQRNLFAASRIFALAAIPGTSTTQMANNLPKVISINILADNIRDDNTEIVQPIKMLYEKPPQRTAIGEFAVYNVQLPRFREVEPNFDNPLHCWLYALDTAHSKNITIREVIEMTASLQKYAERDAGFRQFCDRYNLVAEDPYTREQYYDWISERMREEGIRRAATEDGYKEGYGEGYDKAAVQITRKLISRGFSVAEIIEDTGLDETTIRNLMEELLNRA